MKRVKIIAKKYDLLIFFILANLFSWIVGISLALEAKEKGNAIVPFSMHYVYAFGPALAAIITASKAGEGSAAIILSIMVMVWAVVVIPVYKPTELSLAGKHTLDSPACPPNF